MADKSLATPAGMFKVSLMAAGFALAVIGAAIWDASDGEVRMRRSVERLADDPSGFRGALILRYGIYVVMLGVGSFAFAMGGLGMHMNRTKP